jgi:elongator complex protein 2
MEVQASYENLLISGGASTVSHSVVWLSAATPEEEVVAYICSNHVQIYERMFRRVNVTLRAQEERLDCIAGVFNEASGQFVLVTGSNKGTVNIWISQGRHQQGHLQWLLQQSISLPASAAVSCVAMHYDHSCKMLLLAAGDAKGQVHVYRLSHSEFVLYQKLSFPSSQLPKTMQFSMLMHDSLTLAVGGVDAKVHLYIHDLENLVNDPIDQDSGGFRGVGNLWGHEEWITCLDAISLVLPSNSDTDSIQEVTFLASGSQDNKIRIWKIVAKPITTGAVESLGSDTVVDEEEDDDDEEELDDAGEGSGGNSSGAKGNAGVIIDTEDSQDAEARLSFTNRSQTFLYQVFLESLLIGHEDWVTSIAWMPIHANKALSLDNVALFSTSMDRNMVVWCSNASQGGVWSPLVRVGDVGGALGGSIGGNLLGFVAGCAAPDGQTVLGIGYGGSFHCWTRSNADAPVAATPISGWEVLAESRWTPKPFVSGHFDFVTSLSWASVPNETSSNCEVDDFLLTASSDQTCRIFAPVLAQDPLLVSSSSSSSPQFLGWKEISRPLIHGYNLNAVIPRRFGSSQIMVASDEKIIRHFVMSKLVQESLAHLGGIRVSLHPSEAPLSVDQAFIPELGLSNKPKELMNSQEQKEHESRNVSMIDWEAMMRTTNRQNSSSSSGDNITDSRGLLESQLADYTVWVEVNKWYGHAYDVLCMSQVSCCGRFVASACRAKFAQTQHTPLPKASNYDLGQAGGLGILVWQLPPPLTSTSTSVGQVSQFGEIIARLEDGHEMSVVSLEFAPNGRYLASCGKDRSILLHVQESDPARPDRVTFTSVVAVKNAHKRIIWDASWTADSKYLLTGSRDGALKIWQVILDEQTQSSPVDLHCIYTCTPFAHFPANPSVTAIDVYQHNAQTEAKEDRIAQATNGAIVVVLGSGAGEIRVVRLQIPSTPANTQNVLMTVLCEVPVCHTHTSSVRKVMWRRPDLEARAKGSMVWASCSEDHTVRIHRIQL